MRRRFWLDQINAFIAEGKNEHDLRERSGMRWLSRVLGPSPLIASTLRSTFKASLRVGHFKP